MAAVLCLAGIGDSTRVCWLRFSLIRPARPIRAVASVGLRVWSRLTFADAAVSGLAGRSLAGRCAMLGQADDLGFPGADLPAFGVDGKPNLLGLPGRPRRKPETGLLNRVGLAAKWPLPPLR